MRPRPDGGRRASWLVQLLAGAAVLAAMLPAAAHAAVGFRIPSQSGPASSIKVALPPGGHADVSFVAANPSATRESVSVFGVAAETGATTGVVYAQNARTGAGAWLTPDVTTAALAPGAERPVGVRIQVPAGARAGDHLAGIALERPRSRGAIEQVVRTVVPVHVVVEGDAGAQGTIADPELSTLPGLDAPAVRVTLGNRGSRVCHPKLRAGLVGPGENAIVNRQLDAVLPGDSVRYSLPWPRSLQPGRYEVHAAITGCGTASALDAQLGHRITRDDASGGAGAGGADTGSGGPPPTRPGDTRYTPGPAESSRAPSAATTGGIRGGTPPAATVIPPGLGGARTGIGDANAGRGLLERIAEGVRKNLPAIAQRAGFPLLLLLIVGLILILQEVIDRRDPKLALAPVHRDPDLGFEPWDAVVAVPAATTCQTTPVSLVQLPTDAGTRPG